MERSMDGQVGEIGYYIWGMPGPERSYGIIVAVNDSTYTICRRPWGEGYIPNSYDNSWSRGEVDKKSFHIPEFNYTITQQAGKYGSELIGIRKEYADTGEMTFDDRPFEHQKRRKDKKQKKSRKAQLR